MSIQQALGVASQVGRQWAPTVDPLSDYGRLAGVGSRWPVVFGLQEAATGAHGKIGFAWMQGTGGQDKLRPSGRQPVWCFQLATNGSARQGVLLPLVHLHSVSWSPVFGPIILFLPY